MVSPIVNGSPYYTQCRPSKDLIVTLKVKNDQLVVKGYDLAHALVVPKRSFSAQNLELGGKTIIEVIETNGISQLFQCIVKQYPELEAHVTTSEPDLLAECMQDLDRLIETTRQTLPDPDSYRFIKDDQDFAETYLKTATVSKNKKAYQAAMGNYEYAFQHTRDPAFYREFLSLIAEIQNSEKAADFKALKEKATLLRLSLIHSHIEKKQVQEAIRILEEMPQAEKTHSYTLLLLYIQENNFEKAKTLAAETAEISAPQNPQKTHILYKAACDALAKRDYEFALHLCKIAECLQQPPRWADQMVQMDVLRRQGNHSALKDKLRKLTQALASLPEKLKAHKMLIHLEPTARDYEEILAIYAQKDPLQPSKRLAWQKAYLSFLKGEECWREAEHIAEEMERASPETLEPLEELKEIYIQSEQNEKLADIYKKLGQFFQKKEDYERVFFVYQEALDHCSDQQVFQKAFSDNLVQWAESLQRQEQTAESVHKLFLAADFALSHGYPPEEILSHIEKIRKIDRDMALLETGDRNSLLLHERVITTFYEQRKAFQQSQQQMQSQIEALKERIIQLESVRILTITEPAAEKRRASPPREAQRIDKKPRHGDALPAPAKRAALPAPESPRPPKQSRPEGSPPPSAIPSREGNRRTFAPAAAAAAPEIRAPSAVVPAIPIYFVAPAAAAAAPERRVPPPVDPVREVSREAPQDPLAAFAAVATGAVPQGIILPSVAPTRDVHREAVTHEDEDVGTVSSTEGTAAVAAAIVGFRRPAVPRCAIGKEAWERIFPCDVGNEPPLPPDIYEILGSPCPFFKGQTVQDTHLLVLIPETVNGRDLTPSVFETLIQNPREGYPTKYSTLSEFGSLDYGKKSHNKHKSHWVLMTKEPIPEGCGRSAKEQLEIVQRHGYSQLPHVLTAIVCLCTHHAQTNEFLYPIEKYTRCWGYDANRTETHFSVGGFNDSGSKREQTTGLHIKPVSSENVFDLGFAAVKKL